MGRASDRIDGALAAFLASQEVFFVATAAAVGGYVNVSPKGLDSFRVIAERRVAYLDLTGSGVETIAHLRADGRITLMFCSFQGPPRIVRLYGQGTVCEAGSEGFDELAGLFPAYTGRRAVIDVEVERVAQSCGYGVPLMTSEGPRKRLEEWSEHHGEAGLSEYRAKHNATSIDGLPGVGLPGVGQAPAQRRSTGSWA
ncbi:MAG: pyridoxamine 5'-phosphate oxidase family protein [Acidimicrobiales bacterium]